MRLDAWPTRAQFQPGEPVALRVRLAGAEPRGRVPLAVRIRSLGELIGRFEAAVDVAADGRATAVIDLTGTELASGGRAAAGYAAELVPDGAGGGRTTTAFDIAEHWAAAPRYGFFTDFGPDEDAAESERRAEAMLKLHLNVVQFYDWMASHHTFLPPGEEFTDPLGRRLSLAVVRRKVQLAHERGMAALGYGALYGAEEAFSHAHPDWLLYDDAERPMHLADLFYLQDFTEASPWRAWILDQYEQALASIGFDGIHIDQYGFPKWAKSKAGGSWRTVDVGASFPGFVEEAARRILAVRAEGGSIFNCVNAWPLEGMTQAGADAATYIEVWEPHITYRDLYELVRRARVLRPAKQVILAAYLHPFHPERPQPGAGALNAFRLANAAVHASGGFHLISGEGDALLTDAYYPRYARLDDAQFAAVRRYADFIVRNGELLSAPSGADLAWTHVGPTNGLIELSHPELGAYGAGARPDSLWVIGREMRDGIALQLVNLRGLVSDEWNVDHPQAPLPLEDVQLRVRIVDDVTGVWWDTPDDDVGIARPLSFEMREEREGRFLYARLPRVDVWSSIWWRSGGEA
jgi:dextranase